MATAEIEHNPPTGSAADKNDLEKEESGNGEKNLASTVAQHYNGLPEIGLEKRVESRIFYMRNFNNWVKSIAISRTLHKLRQVRGPDAGLCVLDLGSGKGGDLLKWRKGNISRLVCADIAETSVQQSEERYKEMVERSKRERHQSKIYTAEFIAADCTKVRLKDMYQEPKPAFDLVSCQFSFHYSFESYEQADMMIRNASESLKPGGYFIGSTPDAYELMKRWRAADDNSFGNEVYRVKFEMDSKTDVPLFGAKYDFHLEGVVDCPEFLVYFPVLEKIAAKHGMRLIQRTPFADFFKTNLGVGEGRALLGRMQALEPYPAAEGVNLMGKADNDYTKAEEAVDRLKKEQEENKDSHDRRGNKPIKVGTLSQAEWEAITIYLMFVFQKVSEPTEEKSTDQEETSDTTTEQERGEKRASSEAEEGEEPTEKVAKT